MLASSKEVYAECRRRGIAVGAFNTPNMECLTAVIDAAEELDVPIIVAHAMCHEDVSPLDRIGRVMLALADSSRVMICPHLDHSEDFATVKQAIDLGFKSVMIDYSTRLYEDNIAGTKEVVDYAHAHGVWVEAELGRLPAREGGKEDPNALVYDPNEMYTKPELVPDFIARTGVDSLAIAFGTAHGIYKTKPVLNMDIISEVRKLTDIPLVMHGGSGISHDEYREVIRRGISKINYYSYMSYEGYAAAKSAIEAKSEDFFHELAYKAQLAMKDNALTTLKVFTGA